MILTFEEFNNTLSIDNKATRIGFRIEIIGRDISLIPIEILMRDEKPDNINEINFNIIVNLYPTDGTHWVLVMRREGDPVYYFDSFGVKTPPSFLEEYLDLVSNDTTIWWILMCGLLFMCDLSYW